MATYKVIDVSDWQSKIDWKKVKADGVVGAIIRYADGTTLDKRFAENMKNAKAAGLHVGCYIFSRAKTKAQAEKEAQRLFLAADKYDPDMPLYIDLEARDLEKTADTVAAAFLNKMKELGGRGGVYANLNWWNNYLKKTAKNYSASPFWIAQYNKTMDYKPASVMGMWQYSSSGKVNGISGRVDMDKCYIPYWNDVSVDVEVVPTKDVVVDVELAKTVDELAWEVLKDKWGSGDERKKLLTEAGYDYDSVQSRVNELVPLVEKLAEEVIAGDKWGNGDERKKRLTEAGYDYDVVQKKVNEIIASQNSWVDRANAWAKMIADCNIFHYVKWKSSDEATKTCPICKKRVVLDAVYDAAKKVFKLLGIKINCDKAYVGWNCIGFTYAIWHHGGGLSCKCNDGVISNGIAEKMLQMSEAAALEEARRRIGLKDLKVIINKNGIPKSKWKAGDICMHFSGNEYIHNYYYMGNGKIAESTGSSGKVPNNDQIRIKDYKNKSAKMIIRYVGK